MTVIFPETWSGRRLDDSTRNTIYRKTRMVNTTDNSFSIESSENEKYDIFDVLRKLRNEKQKTDQFFSHIKKHK